MIAILAISGAVGFTILTSVQTTNALSLAERNAARLEMTMSALRQVVIPDAEGRLFVPMGNPSISGEPTSRTALPDWVSGEAITPWGAKYAYCPFAPVAGDGGSADTVHGGLNYAVSVTSDPVIYGASREYVVSGSRSPNVLDAATAPEVLAFLISPSNNSSAVPSCANVFWDGHAWLTTGTITGSVRAVTVDGLADTLSRAPRQLRRHVEEGANGSGLTMSDPTSLTRVLEEWRYLRPHKMTLVLDDDGGDILINPTTINLGAGSGSVTPSPNGFGRHLVLESVPGADPVIDGSVTGALRAPFDLTVDGVDFGPDLGLVGMPGSRVLITNAALSSLETGGAEIVLAGGVSVAAPVGASTPPVTISGGSLAVFGSASIDAQETGGSAIRQRGGGLNVSAAMSVDTGPSSPLFETGGYGPVSVDTAATLDLNGFGPVSMEPYTVEISATTSCSSGSLSCPVTCPDDREALSGTCDPGAVTNVFLRGHTVNGPVFTCSWSQLSEGTPDVADPTGPIAPVASALCAPKR